ncbi:leucyl aminopeptidase [bacterium]|nr:leucyl aminopeptidase [bacterium]
MNIELIREKELLSEKSRVVVPVFEEQIEKETLVSQLGFITISKKNQLKKLIENSNFKGKSGEFLAFNYFTDDAVKTIYLYGVGKKEEYSIFNWKRVVAKLYRKVSAEKITEFTLYLTWTPKLKELDGFLVKTYLGLSLTSYKFDKYKTKKGDEKSIEKVSVYIPAIIEKLEEKQLTDSIKYAENMAEAVNKARAIVNEPPMVMYPESFKNEVETLFKGRKGVKINVFDFEEIKKRGMNLLASVGMGSSKKPYFIEINFKSSKKNVPTLALVGKGLTYDSGGYSLKPSNSMEGMHLDMHGAATMLGTMDMISRYKLDFNVVCYLVVAENLVSGDAYKVSDIVKGYSGKTVEIINTDAEGRLALADGIAYACEQGADAIIEASTLTGAALVALGTQIAAILTKNDNLAKNFSEAAENTEEKFWRLPMEDNYKEDIKSSVADLRNVGKTRYAGTITAGLFLNEFVKENIPFMHLDIAGPAMLDKDIDFYNAGGSGFGIQALAQLILRGKIFS